MSRERLLLILGYEGLQELTERARHTVVTMTNYSISNLDETILYGQDLGVLPLENHIHDDAVEVETQMNTPNPRQSIVLSTPSEIAHEAEAFLRSLNKK